MAKPKLIVNSNKSIDNDYTSFVLPWILPEITLHFDVVYYDPADTYNPHTDIVGTFYAYKQTNSTHWWSSLQQQGHKVIIDHLWDSDVALTPIKQDNQLTLYCPNWMWYLTCLEFVHYGYHLYRPNKERGAAFLMLMNNPRWHRDAIIPLLYGAIDHSIYSYNSRGKHLTDDKAESNTSVSWQRYMNPSWYNNTEFSVVVESYMRNTVEPSVMRTEVSEKLFKPLAHYHPFIVAGSVDTLKYLKSQGFVTFDNMFDESYDSILDDRKRLAAVCVEINRVTQDWRKYAANPSDRFSKETLQRVEHNHYRFFDQSTVKAGIKKEIINPILDFCL
jgi:hypothetical protein